MNIECLQVLLLCVAARNVACVALVSCRMFVRPQSAKLCHAGYYIHSSVLPATTQRTQVISELCIYSNFITIFTALAKFQH